MNIEILEEHKNHKDENDCELKCKYYPLCTFSFEAVRDPRSKIFSIFFPTALLGALFIRGLDGGGAFHV